MKPTFPVPTLLSIGMTMMMTMMTVSSTTVTATTSGNHPLMVATNEDKVLSSSLSVPNDSGVGVVASSASNQQLQQHVSRRLEVGDFDNLNMILKDSILQLQDQEISSSLLDLSVTNLQCSKIEIGDIQVSYEILSTTAPPSSSNGNSYPDTVSILLSVFPFSMDCAAIFDYSSLGGLVRGGGDFISNTVDNGVTTTIVLTTTAPSSFNEDVPTSSTIQNCTSNVIVQDTVIQNGGLVGQVLNAFEDLVSQVISNQANGAVCNIVQELGETFITDLLLSIKNTTDEWTQPIPDEYTDPLLAEQNYVVPEGISLLSFVADSNNTTADDDTTDGSGIGTFIIDLITNANTSSLLGGVVEDPSSPTGTNLEVNVFIRDNFLDENGIFTINFSDPILYDNAGNSTNNTVLFDTHNRISKLLISIYSLRIDGLDTMTRFNPLLGLGQYTFNNELGWENVTIYVDLTLDVESSTLEDPILVNEVPLKEVQNITISFGINQFNMNASLFIAIDENKFNTLPIGALLKDPIICLLSALDTIEVSGLDVSIADIIDPSIVGFASPGTNRIVDTLIDIADIAYVPTLLRAVPYFFQVTVRDLLKNYIEKYVGDNNQCLSDVQSIPSTNIIDYRDLLLPSSDAISFGGSGTSPYGGLMHAIYTIFKDEYFVADPTTGLASINTKFITDITMDQSGTAGRLFFEGNLLNQTRTVKSQGRETTIRLRVFDIYLENIDTFGVPLTLLEPRNNEPYSLHNEASIGVVDSNRPFRIGFRLFLGIANAGSDIENDVAVFLDFKSLQTMFNLLAKLSEKGFMIFPLNNILNLQCWLATMPSPELNDMGYRLNIDGDSDSFAIADIVASVADLSFNISCVKCTGPRIPELGELLSGLQDSADVTTFANGVFNWVTDSLNGEAFQVAADRALHDAKYQCPHSELYDANYVRNDYSGVEAAAANESTISFFLGILIAGGFLLLFVSVLILFTKIIVRRRHGKWVASLTKSHVRVLQKQQALQKDTDESLNTQTVSMFRSAVIPLWIRLTIPIIIVGNIALFVSGHVSLAANVSLSATLAGQSYVDEGLFEFSVAKSTIELWRSGGYGLALIIFALSFAWPYTKQLMVLGLWFAPPTSVSVTTRGSIFLWLDILGKWSIIDIFVLVIILVGFRISIDSPDLDFLPDDFYSVDLLVAPRWGLYSNMIAQILSQLTSHYIIHYHRRIVFDAAPHLDPTRNHEIPSKLDRVQLNGPEWRGHVDVVERLSKHAFSRPHRGESDKLVSRGIVNPLVYFMVLVASVLAVIGSIVPSYSLNQLGLIGLLVEAGQSFEAAFTKFSVFTTITMIIDQASVMGKVKDYIGLSSLSALMVLSVLVVPILQALVVLIQWTVPLTKKRRYRLMVALEALQAWQYMDVFLLAILISSWQLGSISSNLINPYCSAIENLFKELSYYGILKAEDAQCFRTDIALESTFSILFVAAVVLAFVTSFVTKAVTHYFRDLDPLQNPFLHGGLVEDVESPIDDISDTNTLESSTILPTPVLFTDRYRWFLKREIDPKAVNPDAVSTINSVKSQELHAQNTGLTVTTPESSALVADESRNIDTVVESDDSVDDIFVDESPTSRSSTSEASNNLPLNLVPESLATQGNASPVSPGAVLAAGAVAATGAVMVRRGYDVDEDEWIMESVTSKGVENADSLDPSVLGEDTDIVSPTASFDGSPKSSSSDELLPIDSVEDSFADMDISKEEIPIKESNDPIELNASHDATCDVGPENGIVALPSNVNELITEPVHPIGSSDFDEIQTFTVEPNDAGIVSAAPIVSGSMSKDDDDNTTINITTSSATADDIVEEMHIDTSPNITPMDSFANDTTVSPCADATMQVSSSPSAASTQAATSPTHDIDVAVTSPTTDDNFQLSSKSKDLEDPSGHYVSPSKNDEDKSMDNKLSSPNNDVILSTNDIGIAESKSTGSPDTTGSNITTTTKINSNRNTDNTDIVDEESQNNIDDDDENDHLSVGTDYTPRRTLQMN